MDPVVVGIVIALLGVAVGVLLARLLPARSRPAPSAGPAVEPGERPTPPADQDGSPDPGDPAASPVPAGLDDIIAVLGSGAIVVDEAGTVVKASPAAFALGLVRHGRVEEPRIAELVTAARRDTEIREAHIVVERSRTAAQAVHLAARVGRVGTGAVLVLVEDVTAAIRSDEVRRDFVANVSHELKTPVGAMMLLAEATEEASEDPDAVRRFASRLRREGTRLTRLVQEIIDLSRLQYDDPVESAQVVDVDDLVAAALDRSRVDAETRDLRLVSGGVSGLEVLGDEKQLRTALGNLVENAINYSPEHTRVGVGVRGLEEAVEISVTDQGFGIPEEERDRIFERFYRVDPARSRATGGTGLGLSIVKHIAASHGGDVTVWSVPGAGSTFTLRLPLHHPEVEQPLEPPRSIPRGTP